MANDSITNTQPKQTLQQKRAAFALEKISEIANNAGGKISKDLSNFIVGMPTMILTNGIGQTFAYLLSKVKDKHEAERDKHAITFKIMMQWILKKKPDIFGTIDINNIKFEFLKKFNSLTQQQYLEIQHEELRLLEWLKRYARAMEDKSENKKD